MLDHDMDMGGGGEAAGTAAQIAAYIVDFVTAIRATVVSLEMYPPGSKTIANAVAKVSNHLQSVLSLRSKVTLGEVNGMLLVDGQQLDERERRKSTVTDFVAALTERNIQSITFTRQTNNDELIEFLVILSKRPKELAELGDLQQVLASKQIMGIQLNQRIYVATSQEEIEAQKQQEMLLNKLLLEQGGSIEDVDIRQVESILQSPERFQETLERVSTSIDQDLELQGLDDVTRLQERKRRLTDVLERSHTLMSRLGDEELRTSFRDGLVTMLAEKEPVVLEQLFYEERMEPSVISEMDLEPPLLNEMSLDGILGYSQALLDDMSDLRTNAAQMEPEVRQAHVNAVRGTAKAIITNTIQREFFPEVVDMLQGAGLVKPEAAQQLLAQSGQYQSEATRVVSKAPKLLNADGSPDRDAIAFAIEQFDHLSDDALRGVAESMLSIKEELRAHPKFELLLSRLVARLDGEQDDSPSYRILCNFSAELAADLLLNEQYAQADRLLGLFARHADPNLPRHHEQRKRAVASLDLVLREEVLHHLLGVYQQGDPLTQEQVGGMMLKLGPRMVGQLLDLLKQSPDRRVRRQLLDLLKGAGNTLLTLVSEDLPRAENPWYVSRNLLVLLQDVGSPENGELVKPFLSHADGRVRREAVKALMDFDPPNALPALRTMLNDKDIQARRFAISALGSLNDAASIPSLLALIEKRTIAQTDELEDVQVEVVSTLGRLNDPRILPALVLTLRREGMFSKFATKGSTVRARTCFSLSAFRTPESEAAIRKAAKDKDPAVADAAKTVLHGWGL